MFFSGDPSGRKRVDLGGRSSKERDRQMVLEQARLERKRRLGLRQQNAAALKIQKCFRGRKAVAMAKSKVRMEFVEVYGGCCSKVDRSCFSPDSEFLRQLLFFFNTANFNDVSILAGVCQRLGELAKNNDIVSLFSGTNYGSNHAIADYRVKRLACSCLQAVHYNRDQIKKNILAEYNSNWEAPLMDTAVMLLNGNLPWTCNVVDFLIHKRVFSLLKDIIVSGMTSKRAFDARQVIPLERVIILLASHTAGDKCFCKNKDAAWKFSSEILSIPFLWKHFSCLKEVFATELLGRHQIHQMAIALSNDSFCIHDDASTKYPSNICLLGNLLETATVMLSQSCCAHDVVIDFAAVISHLLEMMPSSNEVSTINRDSDATDFDNEMLLDPKVMNVDADLQKQIFSAIDSSFLECLVNALFLDASLVNYSLSGGPSKKELSAVKAICHFLYVAFAVLPDDRIMTGLAYRTEIVLILWKFIKWCHETQQWPSFSLPTINWPEDVPGWLLPLAVFCPIYKHMLTIIDNEEFYDQEKPLSLNEIRSLVIILKQVLWELLWLTPATAGYPKSVSTSQRTTNNIKSRVHIAISELLNQLQDWNNRRPFLSSTDFHAPVGEIFVSQALTQNTKAHEILKHAPFLVPFTSRVKIFTSLLANARQSDAHHPAFIRHTVTIRRDHIFEDAFTKLRSLSADDLRGRIRISFINELGAEEAGVDGGGIFKDFLENILRETFSVQYGLFRETNSHLLYPNPASGLVHEQHLQYFHFLGTLLGKAMFEGILVDIPFATFFLSKLKHKRNYLNDLPSLDPELYRHLLFLKHYKGDVSELELYFVLVNNDYGEQKEEELLPGGKNIRVTKDNVITFIHLVAHYRLNFQIRLQSLHFLRGFQQLINTEWIDMFCEQEIQNLISGSSDSMDLQDLCSNAIYSGGYHEDHVVIKMFWDVVKSFSSEDQKKFLKFVTGCSRGPLLGFKYLEPKFCIQRAASLDATEEDLDRLPTSATCMNLLKLPPYKSLEQLRDKLVYAVSAEAGFDLS